jgi:hypothetical protein
MPKVTPKKIEEKIETTVAAWEELAPTKKFGGLTLAEFKDAIAPSINARKLIDQLQNQLGQAINQRDDADNLSLTVIQRVVSGVLADPTEGPNSSIYERMGYTRQSERKSGLTQKKKEPPKP